MKILFTIKYIGKTLLIFGSVISFGKLAHMGIGYDATATIAASAYCYGSIQYQSYALKKLNQSNFK